MYVRCFLCSLNDTRCAYLHSRFRSRKIHASYWFVIVWPKNLAVKDDRFIALEFSRRIPPHGIDPFFVTTDKLFSFRFEEKYWECALALANGQMKSHCLFSMQLFRSFRLCLCLFSEENQCRKFRFLSRFLHQTLSDRGNSRAFQDRVKKSHVRLKLQMNDPFNISNFLSIFVYLLATK